MLSATALAILFVPLFFALVAGRTRTPPARKEPNDADADARAEDEEARRSAAARSTVHA